MKILVPLVTARGLAANAASSTRRPRLIFTPASLTKLYAYINACPDTEIGGFGYVAHVRRTSDYHIVTAGDVFIVQQEVAGASVDWTAGTSARAITAAMQTNRDDDLHLQWHSHPRGFVGFSSTDARAIERLAVDGYFIALVTSYAPSAMHAELHVYGKHRFGAAMDIFLELELEDALNAAVVSEAKRLVTVTVIEPEPELDLHLGGTVR